MNSSSPIREAFAALREAPELWPAEVAWRWAFGAAACVLAFLTLWTWLDTLPVTRVDRLMLASGSPQLMGQALSHMFAGSAARLLRGCAVLLPGLVLGWTVAASAGRAAILRTLMPESRAHWRSLLGVSFVRAMVAVAAGVAQLGALIVFVRLAAPRPPAQPRPDAAWLLLFAATLLITSCWSVMNWFLGVAAIYATAARGIGDTLSATLANFREHTGKWFWIASVFSVVHMVLFLVFCGIGPLPLAVAKAVPLRFTTFALTVVTLMYFALADAISVLRFVAYTRVAEREAVERVQETALVDF